MYRLLPALPFAILLTTGCQETPAPADTATTTVDSVAVKDSLIHPDEKHFKSLKQLTFGGDNAEAYWSFNGQLLSFQVTNT